jgi:hypothetical protein
VASQAAFYRICFSQVFRKIPPLQFLIIRKLADPILATRLAFIYYSCLLSGLLVTILLLYQRLSIHSMAVTVSFILLLFDVYLAKRYNIPLNTQARNTSDATETFASELQRNWMKWIDVRSYLTLTGFTILMLVAVAPSF